MSVIPEAILQRAIIAGFRAMRQDDRILDAIFRHLNQIQLQAVKSFLLETSIDFSINYPRKEPTLPSLVLLLRNEAESETWLGDVMGDQTDLYVPDVELSYDTLGGHGASTSDSSGLPVKVAGPLVVQAQTASGTITFADGEDITSLVSNLLENPTGCLILYVVEGTGAGETYDILRLRSDGLDISGAFNPILDDTSVVDIRKADDPMLAVGEPSRVYSSTGSFLRKGANFAANYNLHVMAGQQDQVIYLYATIKALLLSQRAFLESQGVINLKIGGSDFAPRTEFIPDEVFQRMMTLQFTTPFSFLEEQEVFAKIQINYDVYGDSIIEDPIIL